MFEIFVMCMGREDGERWYLIMCSTALARRLRNNCYKYTARTGLRLCILFVYIRIFRVKRDKTSNAKMLKMCADFMRIS